MNRHPTPAPPDQDQLLVIVAGVIATACILVWTAGQLAGRIWGGSWPQASPLDGPLILARVIANPGEPSTAWPGSAADLIPAPAAYYGVLAFLVVAATIIAVFAWRLWQSMAAPDDDGARWATPRDLRPLLVRHPEPGRLTLGTEHPMFPTAVARAGVGPLYEEVAILAFRIARPYFLRLPHSGLDLRGAS